MKDTKQEILDFWFEETKPAQWFQKNSEFDREISDRFLNDYNLCREGVYDGWQEEAKGCLALCILLDQFPRNMFRGSARAFKTDAQALLIARHAIGQGFDKTLDIAERRFIYLPYEHSENLSDQKTSVSLFEDIKDEDPQGYEYALKHLEVIERFGRFPHRNDVLGRENTDEEEKYLAQGGGF